jgi:hypothetical protein
VLVSTDAAVLYQVWMGRLTWSEARGQLVIEDGSVDRVSLVTHRPWLALYETGYGAGGQSMNRF